jgi:hypothetical protein
MSSRDDRVWTNPTTFQVLEENRYLVAKLATLYRDWGQVRARWHMMTAPTEGRRCGESLLPPGEVITKRFGATMAQPPYGLRKFFGRTQRQYMAQGGIVAEAEINCIAMAPAVLAKAAARAGRKLLDQMLGHGPPAGRILSIASDGTVIRVSMLITDPAAVAKMRGEVYSGVIAEFDEGDRLHRVSLVDSDSLAKRSDANVIAKVYDRSQKVKRKKLRMAQRVAKSAGVPLAAALAAVESVRKGGPPALPPSAQAVITEADRVQSLAGAGADRLLVKTLQGRVDTQLGVELVKAARRRPTAYGDGIIKFLRHGKP